jgi:hypothetical protein
MSSSETSVSQSGTEHHGVTGFFQDHWKLLLAGLIIFLIVAAAFGLRNSPFWDLLSSLFGAGAAAATVIEDQLNKCFGSFTDLINPFGGCFIGVFALGYGILWVAATVLSSKTSSEKSLVEQAKFETGKTSTDLAKTVLERQKSISDVELIDQLKKSGISDPTKAQLDAARAVIANNGIAQETKQAIDSSSMSPSERKAATENLIESNRVANEEVMSEKDIRAEDVRDVEDTAKEFEEPVVE